MDDGLSLALLVAVPVVVESPVVALSLSLEDDWVESFVPVALLDSAVLLLDGGGGGTCC